MHRLLLVISWALLPAAVAMGQLVVDFEELALPPESAAPADASATPFVSRLVEFNRTWNQDFNCCPAAWAYSNQTDLTTAGFTNPFSAYALPQGGGVLGSANFAIANNSFLGEALVTLPAPTQVDGMYVTNNTYAYLAVAEGNDGQQPGNPPLFVKGPFEADDWFRLEIVGRDIQGAETARVPFYLADFRNGASIVVDQWTWVDLAPLGEQVASLAFELSSTDNGMFGMNTPAYFAVDNLTIQTLPGDFDLDFQYACGDVDALVDAIVAGNHATNFDLNADELVDGQDLSMWLELAGAASSPTGVFLPGDANLDGGVDGADYLRWHQHRFTSAGWCGGDFDASGSVDGFDLLIWNAHKFQPAAVPEPALGLWAAAGWAFLAAQRRRRL